MTLRFRLVTALGVLLLAGLAVFGYGTYQAYSRSQYQRLDDQVRNSLPYVTQQLYDVAGINGDGRDEGPGDHGGDGPGPSVVAPVSTYAELRDATGAVLASIQVSSSTSQPDLPQELPTDLPAYLTVHSVEGSSQWRVYVEAAPGPDGRVLVIALPSDDVRASLNRLLLIESLAGVALLVVLTGGSWFVLRRGLRPLEHMAASARAISGGNLSERVVPADGRSEVGQLGLALNTMLEEIETAFRARQASEDRLRQFLADASHELRTPLTSIQGFAELYRLSATDARIDQSVMMRRIEEESHRMKGLVEDLLLLARLDRTRPIERVPTDLAVIAADACSDAAAVAPDRPITLDAPDPVVVPGDAAHLHQAVANLMTNALRHTPEGSSIEVAVHLVAGHGVLTVRDHGPGLDDEARAHAFDRFWQADQARTGSGAGLGLSIVAAIAEEHGGSASVANHPDGGAVFTLDLPC
jgi:two-component system OmpR family sensor kinase